MTTKHITSLHGVSSLMWGGSIFALVITFQKRQKHLQCWTSPPDTRTRRFYLFSFLRPEKNQTGAGQPYTTILSGAQPFGRNSQRGTYRCVLRRRYAHKSVSDDNFFPATRFGGAEGKLSASNQKLVAASVVHVCFPTRT